MPKERSDYFVGDPVYAGRAVCHDCRHRVPGSFDFCAAFPKGIPKAIMLGKHDHRESYPGDNGITYEKAGP